MKCRADLHIHTVLSPCGDLSMSPSAIVRKAKTVGLDIIGICDHNSTLNAQLTYELGKHEGFFVLMGAEVTSKEDVHSLCFMPTIEKLNEFQLFLDSHQTFFPNSPSDFGNQFVVDKYENIIDEIPYLLINALDLSINELSEKVFELGGIFIPAHVDRNSYSLSNQLGMVPDNLEFNVLELSPYAYRNKFFEKFPWFTGYSYITNSDAHFISDIGKSYNYLNLERIDFSNIKEALRLALTKFPE